MGGRRKGTKRERTGTYQALEDSIKENECGDAGCLVSESRGAQSESELHDRVTVPSLWPLQLPVWPRRKYDRSAGQMQRQDQAQFWFGEEVEEEGCQFYRPWLAAPCWIRLRSAQK
jgi:hypothetical protein